MGLLWVGDFVEDGKRLEEKSGRARRSDFEPPIPVFEKEAEVVTQSREFHESRFGCEELLGGKSPDLSAWRRAPLPFAQDDRKLSERKTEGQRAPDHQHPAKGLLRIDAIVVGRARRPGQNAHALIVAQRVRAEARPPRQLA